MYRGSHEPGCSKGTKETSTVSTPQRRTAAKTVSPPPPHSIRSVCPSPMLPRRALPAVCNRTVNSSCSSELTNLGRLPIESTQHVGSSAAGLDDKPRRQLGPTQHLHHLRASLDQSSLLPIASTASFPPPSVCCFTSHSERPLWTVHSPALTNVSRCCLRRRSGGAAELKDAPNNGTTLCCRCARILEPGLLDEIGLDQSSSSSSELQWQLLMPQRKATPARRNWACIASVRASWYSHVTANQR